MQQMTAQAVSVVAPVALSSGSLSNLIDKNLSTVAETAVPAGPAQSVTFWWVIDMGFSVRVTKVILQDWYETGSGTPDTGFQIRYSDTPLSAVNLGTLYGSSFDAVFFPTTQDTTQTGDITARYWGLLRAGVFDNTNRIGSAEMEVYTNDQGGQVF